MQLAPQQVHQRYVHPSPLVLESGSLKLLTPTTDRDRTVSRRSEPSSRATLMGEQPNPWDLLQPQDVTSRHRGAKPLRRCELLGVISLLSPEYHLSFERWPFHAEPPDHYALVSYLLLTPLQIILGLLNNSLSRRNEFDADTFAAKTYKQAPMRSALSKISTDSLANLNPHPLYVAFNYTHPPLVQRLKNVG